MNIYEDFNYNRYGLFDKWIIIRLAQKIYVQSNCEFNQIKCMRLAFKYYGFEPRPYNGKTELVYVGIGASDS